MIRSAYAAVVFFGDCLFLMPYTFFHLKINVTAVCVTLLHILHQSQMP